MSVRLFFFDLFLGLGQVLHDQFHAFVDKLGFEVGLLVFLVDTTFVIYSDDGIEQVFTPVDVGLVGFEVNEVGTSFGYGDEGVGIYVLGRLVIAADGDVGSQFLAGNIMFGAVEYEVAISGGDNHREAVAFYLFMAFERFVGLYDNVSVFVDAHFELYGGAESIFDRRRRIDFDGIFPIQLFLFEQAVAKYVFLVQPQILYHFAQGGVCRYHVDFVIDFTASSYEVAKGETFQHGCLHAVPSAFFADEYVGLYQIDVFFYFKVGERDGSADDDGDGKQIPVFEIFLDETREIEVYQCTAFIEIFHEYLGYIEAR